MNPDEVRSFATKLQQFSATSPGDMLTDNGASLLAALVNKSIQAQIKSASNGLGSEFVNTVSGTTLPLEKGWVSVPYSTADNSNCGNLCTNAGLSLHSTMGQLC